MSSNPATLSRFWREFSAAEPDAVLGGIYAGKGGYHNTRANHVAGRNGGSPSDYSIRRKADRLGPADKAAALDITFRSAQRGQYGTIAKYSKRLMAAGRRRDARFYDNDGQTAIVREFFGNTDNDREVEGWSWYREYAVSSDSSHLWHIHLSFTRAYLNNWEKLAPILDVLLDRNGDEDMPLTNADADKVAKAVIQYPVRFGPSQRAISDLPEDFETSLANAVKIGAANALWARRNGIPTVLDLIKDVADLVARPMPDEERQQLAAAIADRTDRMRIEITRENPEES